MAKNIYKIAEDVEDFVNIRRRSMNNLADSRDIEKIWNEMTHHTRTAALEERFEKLQKRVEVLEDCIRILVDLPPKKD